MNTLIKLSITTAVIALSMGTVAFAQTASAPSAAPSGVPHHHHPMKKVFEACATANNITLPAKGSGVKLSSDDRNTLHGCVKEFVESMRTCAQNAGVPKFTPGQKPDLTTAQKASLKACRDQGIAAIAAK